MYPFYLGIDLHLKNTFVVLMDKVGHIAQEQNVANDEFETYLEKNIPPNTFAVLEATRNWPFMHECLAKYVKRVELVHPKEVKAIANAAVKTDKIDARVLANLARLDYLPIGVPFDISE